jgi:hypothetical protein
MRTSQSVPCPILMRVPSSNAPAANNQMPEGPLVRANDNSPKEQLPATGTQPLRHAARWPAERSQSDELSTVAARLTAQKTIP